MTATLQKVILLSLTSGSILGVATPTFGQLAGRWEGTATKFFPNGNQNLIEGFEMSINQDGGGVTVTLMQGTGIYRGSGGPNGFSAGFDISTANFSSRETVNGTLNGNVLTGQTGSTLNGVRIEFTVTCVSDCGATSDRINERCAGVYEGVTQTQGAGGPALATISATGFGVIESAVSGIDGQGPAFQILSDGSITGLHSGGSLTLTTGSFDFEGCTLSGELNRLPPLAPLRPEFRPTIDLALDGAPAEVDEPRCPAGTEGCEEEEQEQTCVAPPSQVLWINPAGGALMDDKNWQDDIVPFDDQVAVFNVPLNGGSQPITLSFDVVHEALKVRSGFPVFELNQNQYELLDFSRCSAALDVSFDPQLLGNVVFRNGTLDAHTVSIASQTNRFGRVDIDGADLKTSDCRVGDSGEGVLAIFELGIIDAERMTLGHDAGSNGIVTINDAALNITPQGSLIIGLGGAGEMTVENDGSVRLLEDGELVISQSAGSEDSRLIIQGASLLSHAGRSTIGAEAESLGQLTLLEGSEADLGRVILGQDALARGLIIVEEAELETTALRVGDAGQGSVEVAFGGQIRSDSRVELATESGSRGELVIEGDRSVAEFPVGGVIVGRFGEGTLRVSDHARLSGGDLRVAVEEESTGSVEIVGTGSNDNTTGATIELLTLIGERGTGSLSITQGAIVLGGVNSNEEGTASTLGVRPDARGQATVAGEGSEWHVTTLIVGFEGSGEVFIENGARVSCREALLGNEVGSIGDVFVRGGSRWQVDGRLTIGVSGLGSVEVDQDSTLITGELLVTETGGIRGQNIIVGGQPRTSNSTNRIAMQSTDTTEPGIFVESLTIENGAELASASITLNPGGVLAGDANLRIDLSNPGLLSPGRDACTAGQMVIDGDFTQNPAGALHVKLGGSEPGASHDVLQVTGTADLAGTLVVEAIDGFVPQAGDQFEILTAASIAGAFDEVTGSGDYAASYEGNRVQLTVLRSPAETAAPCGDTGAPQFNPGNLCGAGVCGSGLGPMFSMMMIGLGLLRRGPVGLRREHFKRDR